MKSHNLLWSRSKGIVAYLSSMVESFFFCRQAFHIAELVSIIYVQCKPVSSTSFKTNKLFAQITFWVQFSLITTICHLFCSNTLFAQTFKSVPMVFELTGFYCICSPSNFDVIYYFSAYTDHSLF